MPVSTVKWAEIARETLKDEKLRRVMELMHLSAHGNLEKPYQHFKGEWSVVRLLLKGTKLVLPTSMRAQMLRFVHEGHLGIEKCKRRARDVSYWLGIHRVIVTLVQRFEICQCHRYQQPKRNNRTDNYTHKSHLCMSWSEFQ